jgi:hypothetical protein
MSSKTCSEVAVHSVFSVQPWDPKPKIQRAYCGRFKQVNMCSSRGELRASDRASPADGGPLADLILHNEAVAARIAKDFLPPKLRHSMALHDANGRRGRLWTSQRNECQRVLGDHVLLKKNCEPLDKPKE